MKLCKLSIECYVNNKDIKYESHYFLLILIHFTVIYAFDVIYISSICKVGMLYNIIWFSQSYDDSLESTMMEAFILWKSSC